MSPAESDTRRGLERSWEKRDFCGPIVPAGVEELEESKRVKDRIPRSKSSDSDPYQTIGVEFPIRVDTAIW